MIANTTFESSKKVIERVSRHVSELDELGNLKTKVVYEDVDVSSEDYVKDLPKLEEYTLSNLIAAGVPLEEMNVDGLLASSTSAVLDKVELGKAILNNEYNKSEK